MIERKLLSSWPFTSIVVFCIAKKPLSHSGTKVLTSLSNYNTD